MGYRTRQGSKPLRITSSRLSPSGSWDLILDGRTTLPLASPFLSYSLVKKVMDVGVAVFPPLTRGSPKQTYVIFNHFTPLYATFLHLYRDLRHFYPLSNQRPRTSQYGPLSQFQFSI